MKKKVICILFLFSSIGISAQPGDIPEFRESQVETITNKLIKNPNNLELKWKRVNLIFNPYFELNTVPKKNHNTNDSYSFKNFSCTNFRGIDILSELTYLIDNIVDLKTKGYDIHEILSDRPAKLYLLRGKLFYLKNLKYEAYNDFLKALKFESSDSLKEDIVISLVAYYYNLEYGNKENYEKALEYIDLVTPIKYESQPRKRNFYSDIYLDKFQREKILLLKKTNKIDRLTGYLKNISLTHFNLYLNEISKPLKYQNSHSYTISQILETAFRNLSELCEIYNRNNQHDKSKKIMTEITKLLNEI